MLQRLYDRTLALAAHRHALSGLAVISFVESSVFPIPPDVLLIPMVLADRTRAWLIAAICTVASVLGGLLGYAIGYYLFDAVGQPILEFYGYTDKFHEMRAFYAEWGFWFVAAAGFTPFPYKVITITSGVMALDPLVFLVASTVSRGARFFVECALLWYFGPPIRRFIENNLPALTVAFFVILFGGFVAVRYVF
ncbi:YqaA family protein [Ferruginivarius sediminum]|uniref:DedA family protein n=1 Tax=Ferruginivarius sediminum TaxID=2661937 RepID=A0A369T5Y4_9PROT|nr:YqaA family protein [Ferruginivarius sediminum]RDD60730.1 DedA family protein [Ferruginivarius sediminum]